MGVLKNPPHFIREEDWDHALDYQSGFPVEFWCINLSVDWYDPETLEDGSVELGACYETEVGGTWELTPTFSSRFLALKALQSITPDEFDEWCTNHAEGALSYDGGDAEVTWFPKGSTFAETLASKQFFFDRLLGSMNDSGMKVYEVEGDSLSRVYNAGRNKLKVKRTDTDIKLVNALPVSLPETGIPL